MNTSYVYLEAVLQVIYYSYVIVLFDLKTILNIELVSDLDHIVASDRVSTML